MRQMSIECLGQNYSLVHHLRIILHRGSDSTWCHQCCF